MLFFAYFYFFIDTYLPIFCSFFLFFSAFFCLFFAAVVNNFSSIFFNFSRPPRSTFWKPWAAAARAFPTRTCPSRTSRHRCRCLGRLFLVDTVLMTVIIAMTIPFSHPPSLFPYLPPSHLHSLPPFPLPPALPPLPPSLCPSLPPSHLPSHPPSPPLPLRWRLPCLTIVLTSRRDLTLENGTTTT